MSDDTITLAGPLGTIQADPPAVEPVPPVVVPEPPQIKSTPVNQPKARLKLVERIPVQETQNEPNAEDAPAIAGESPGESSE